MLNNIIASLNRQIDKVRKEECEKGNGYFVKEEEAFRCIPSNPCTSKDAADKKYCVKVFKDVQVGMESKGALVVKHYVKNVLKWSTCADMVVPKSKALGQDYISCRNPENGEPRVFEFDDLSETNNVLAANNYAYGLCIAHGGKATFPKKDADTVECTKLKKAACEEIGGLFSANICYMDVAEY